MRTLLFTLLFCLTLPQVHAQIGDPFKGEDMDTIYFVELDSFTISARPMKNYNYSRYEAIVKKVYPFADTAVQTIKALEAMEFSARRDEKQYKKQLEDALRTSFEEKLRNLSRTQGDVLIDIIERNTGRTMYDILKDVKSGSTAFWWNSLGKAYGYDLKEGYKAENNPTLEQIIADYEKRYKR